MEMGRSVTPSVDVYTPYRWERIDSRLEMPYQEPELTGHIRVELSKVHVIDSFKEQPYWICRWGGRGNAPSFVSPQHPLPTKARVAWSSTLSLTQELRLHEWWQGLPCEFSPQRKEG
jgi:hypothetical protein